MLTIDPVTRGHLRRREFDFDRALRRDPRLNITVRLAWLMTVLAYPHGFASMSIHRMATELHTTRSALWQARAKLVHLGLFVLSDRGRYKPVARSKEDRVGFWRRIQSDRRLDLTARCAWLLCDKTNRGEVELSLAEIGAALGITPSNAAAATRRLRNLGHFDVLRGGGRHHKTVYARVAVNRSQSLVSIDQKDMFDETTEISVADPIDASEHFQKFARRRRASIAAKRSEPIDS